MRRSSSRRLRPSSLAALCVLAACALPAFGCGERTPTAPAVPDLPTPPFEVPERPPASQAVERAPELFPPGGSWDLRFEYVARQRMASRPPLDVTVRVGSGTVRATSAGALGLADLRIEVEPESSEIAAGVERLLRARLDAMRSSGRVAGVSSRGLLLDFDPPGAAWGIADAAGLVEAVEQRTATEERTIAEEGEARPAVQAWRLTLHIRRR